MTVLLTDRTLRTAPTPDPRLWRSFGNGTTDVAENNGAFQFNTLSGAYGRHIIDQGTGLTTDHGILALVKRSSGVTARLRLWVSHDGTTTGSTSENATNGLAASINNNGDLSVFKSIAGTITVYGTALAGKVTTAPTWVRLERTAGLIRCRVWLDGAAEPTTWDHSYTDDSGLPAGRAGVSAYASSAPAFTAGKITIYTPAGGIPEPFRAKLYTRPNGVRIPYGRHTQTRSDDASEASPSWLTGTTTLDTANGLRTLSAAAGATSTLAGPAVSADAHILTVHNLRLSADADMGVALSFTDGTTVCELRQDSADAGMRLVVGTASTPVTYRLRGNGEGPRHRTITLLLVPRVAQVIAMSGDWRTGSVIGWATLPGAVTRTSTVTPRLIVTAGAASQSVAYTGLAVEVHRL